MRRVLVVTLFDAVSGTCVLGEWKMNENQQYDAMEQRVIAAFNAFSTTYAVINPPPQRQAGSVIGIERKLIIGGTIVMVLAAMVVSGSRTIAEFGSVGIFAFLMLELGSLILGIRRALTATNQERFNRWLVKLGLAVCFGVMLAGNLDATFKDINKRNAESAGALSADAIKVSDVVSTIIAIAIAVSAPTLTLIAGDLIGVEIVEISRQRAVVDNTHRSALDGWYERRNASWDAQKSRMGATFKISRPQQEAPIHSLYSVNEQPNERATAYSKNMSAKDVARNWILAARETNPAVMTMRIDDLWTLIQADTQQRIGRTSVHNARKDLSQASQGTHETDRHGADDAS